MRKFAVLTGALVALVAFAAIAFAADNNQTIAVSVVKKKAGTKTKPTSTGTIVKLANTGTDPAPANHVLIFFDKNLVFNGAKFPKCSLAKAKQNRCPKNTQIGTGVAAAKAGGTTITLDIKAFNGSTGKSLLLALRQRGGSLAIDLESKLLKGSGLYGIKLETNVPKASYNAVPGFYTPLVKFDVTIPPRTVKVKGKTVPYIGLVGCTAGKLRFKTQFDYVERRNADGSLAKPAPPSAKPTTTAACTK
jgi:hypothetical protein